MLLTLFRFNFNTSHVNVNLRLSRLSHQALRISIHLMLMLIENKVDLLNSKWHFNTSHVNVNPDNQTCIHQLYQYFNTSHVNVNPVSIIVFSLTFDISIHLMLMLIKAGLYLRPLFALFQYISC